MTPLKPNSALHQTATKRSLYRDLENQYLATQNFTVAAAENIDPHHDFSDLNSSSELENHYCEEPSTGLRHFSLSITKNAVLDTSTLISPQKRLYDALDYSVKLNFESPVKSPRKRDEQHARYVSALALIQLAQGAN
jgi:hypothetical protein